jgi:hypothetical protein
VLQVEKGLFPPVVEHDLNGERSIFGLVAGIQYRGSGGHNYADLYADFTQKGSVFYTICYGHMRGAKGLRA